MNSTKDTHSEDRLERISDPIHDTYAVDEANEAVTVVGTMGQDPDAKQTISWRTWVILLIFGLMQIQNTYIGYAVFTDTRIHLNPS